MRQRILQSLSAAALVGIIAGTVVGLIEAGFGAGAASRLSTTQLAAAWVVTVAAYLAMGFVIFVPLGVIVGFVTQLVIRRRTASMSAVFVALAGMAIPAAVMLGHAESSEDGAAIVFLLLRVLALSVSCGAVAWMLFRLVSRRVQRGGVTGRGRQPALRWLVVGVPLVSACAVAVAVDRVALPSSRPGAPNVVLITVDALRADRVGTTPGAPGLTPALNRFSRDAVVFENAFASAPWTTASLTSMMASLYPSETGLVVRRRTEDEAVYQGGLLTPGPVLAETLSAHGYETAAEAPNPQIRRGRGLARGFVTFRNPVDFNGERVAGLPRLGADEAWVLRTSLGLPLARRVYRRSTYYTAPGLRPDQAERVVRDAWTWLSRDHRRPFFQWLHLMDTHVPYDPPQKSPATIAAAPRPPWKLSADVFKQLAFGKIKADDRQKVYLEALYDDGVRYADRWIGRFLEDLRRTRQYDNTLIIVSADHGEEFWEHGGFEHGHTLYDEVLRVPLLIKFPRQAYGGRRVATLTGLIDVMPTVLDVAGLPVPAGLRGESLLAVARGASRSQQTRGLFAEYTLYGPESKALRTPRYRVIRDDSTGVFHVYDLRSDPKERDDLAATDPTAAVTERRKLADLAKQSRHSSAAWSRRAVTDAALDSRTIQSLHSLGYVGQ